MKQRWVTEFTYDSQNRLIEKKIPEAEAIYTVYDRLGRVVLTQDGNLRAGNRWMFTKYDVHGRTILTGVYTDPNGYDRAQMQAHLDQVIDGGNTPGHYAYYETPDANGPEGYTDNAFPPIGDCQIWSVTYYDDYNFPGAANFAYIADPDYDPNNDKAFYRLRGKVTGVKTRVLGESNVFRGDNRTYGAGHTSSQYDTLYYKGNHIRLTPGFRTQPGQTVKIGPNVTIPQGAEQTQWLITVSYYDKYGRVIQTQSTNHLGGADVSHTLYDFSGKVLKEKVVHSTPAGTTTVEKRYQYDHAGRVTRVFHKINGGTEILLVANTYNELGQLIEKNLHSTDGGNNFLQSVDFTYNERGWLTRINDEDLSDGEGDLFGMRLYYQEGLPALNGDPQYNGNISAVVWKSASDNVKRGYGYGYDGINQLLYAQYARNNSGSWSGQEYDQYSVSNLSYDLNGNIQTLDRRGPDDPGGYIDRLTYTYHGNQLIAVEDAVPTHYNYDFRNGNVYSGTDEYAYDANGNMTRDDNKGIAVTYNELDLPTEVDFGNDNRIEWIYSASGEFLYSVFPLP